MDAVPYGQTAAARLRFPTSSRASRAHALRRTRAPSTGAAGLVPRAKSDRPPVRPTWRPPTASPALASRALRSRPVADRGDRLRSRCPRIHTRWSCGPAAALVAICRCPGVGLATPASLSWRYSATTAGRLPRSFQSDSGPLLAVGGCQQRRPLVGYRFHVDAVVLATLSAVIAILLRCATLGVHFPFLGGPEVSRRGLPIEFDCRSAQDAATRPAPATVAGVVRNRPPGQPHRGSRDGCSALRASRRRPPTGPLGVLARRRPVSQIRADLAWPLGGAKGLSTASAACSEIVLAITPASG